MMKKWDLVRKKNPKAKRNRLVVHEGNLMRMSHCDGDGVLLRWQSWIHPACDSLVMERTPAIEAAVNLLSVAVERLINDMDNGGQLDETTAKEMRRMVADQKRKYSYLSESAE